MFYKNRFQDVIAGDLLEGIGVYGALRNLVHQDLGNPVAGQGDNLEPPLLPVTCFYITIRMDDPVHRGADVDRVGFQGKSGGDRQVG